MDGWMDGWMEEEGRAALIREWETVVSLRSRLIIVERQDDGSIVMKRSLAHGRRTLAH
jgi:hypothetical protein